MDVKQNKIKPQINAINLIYPKNKKRVNSSLMKLIISLLATLTLNILIFIFLFYSKKKIENNLKKKYKRKLEDYDSTDNIKTDDIDIDTDDTTYDTSQNIIYNTDSNINTTHDTSQDTTYLTDYEGNNTYIGKIINNCSGIEFFTNQCHPYKTNDEQDTEYIYHIMEQIEDGVFNEIFNRTIEEDTNIIQKDNNIIYQISTVSSQYSTNYSKVSLEKCESILKDVYSIDKDEKLILLKLEHNKENSKIPIIEYQLFTKDGKKLNLSYCDTIPEKVSIPVNINENEEFIHNPYSRFYQDKCYPYTSEYDTDLTIYDRKNDFNEKFLSLCEKNCIYLGYNRTNKEVNCECKTKTDFPKNTTTGFDLKDLLFHFIDIKKYSTLFVITCTKVLFSSEGFKYNFGCNYNIVIFAEIILLGAIFVIKGYNSFQAKIKNLIKQKFEKKEDNQNDTDCSDLNFRIDNQDQKKKKYTQDDVKVRLSYFYNDHEMNELKFSDAKKIDERTFGQIYLSHLKTNNIFIFTFGVCDDYNSAEIKICLFLFWLSLSCFFEALFFDDSTMHKIYKNKGKYKFIHHLGKIFFSIIFAKIITIIVEYFALSEDNIAEITMDQNKISIEDMNNGVSDLDCYLKKKFALSFGVMILFILFFWYYLSSFCAVFKNSQMQLIINTLLGYVFALIIPFLIAFITGYFRFYGLKRAQIDEENKDNGKCCYKFSGCYEIIDKICDIIKDCVG